MDRLILMDLPATETFNILQSRPRGTDQAVKDEEHIRVSNHCIQTSQKGQV